MADQEWRKEQFPSDSEQNASLPSVVANATAEQTKN